MGESRGSTRGLSVREVHAPIVVLVAAVDVSCSSLVRKFVVKTIVGSARVVLFPIIAAPIARG